VNPSDLCTRVSVHGENALFVSPAYAGNAKARKVTAIAAVSALITAMDEDGGSFR
jgi:hypothetical protein